MFNFWPQNGTKVPLHESDNLLQRPFSVQLQWVEMKLDWTLLRKGSNFPSPLSTLNLLFPESDDFLQSPFFSKQSRACYLTILRNAIE